MTGGGELGQEGFEMKMKDILEYYVDHKWNGKIKQI